MVARKKTLGISSYALNPGGFEGLSEALEGMTSVTLYGAK
jgi:hypothetical protein